MRGAFVPSVALALAAAVAVCLQGCGKKGGSPSPAPSPPGPPTRTTTTTTATTGRTTTISTTTITATKTAPEPMPSGPARPFQPLRGISYQAPPGKSVPTLPGLDMAQAGYRLQWGPDGRDDLGMMQTLGASAVRLYSGLGAEYTTDHGEFLDRAEQLGLSVLLGFHTQNICTDFNCFDSWKAAASKVLGSDRGFTKGGKWHPAIKAIVLMNAPDELNFLQSAENPTRPNCTTTDAQCRMTAVLSGLDGLLAAENENDIDGADVLLTVAWSFAKRDSIDGQVKDAEGLFGFQDMVAVVDRRKVVDYIMRRPSWVDYKPQTSMGDIVKAYRDRWIHSVNAPSTWKFIKEKIGDKFAPYSPKQWFIAEFSALMYGQDVHKDLADMDAEARKNSSFVGVVFNGFQRDYTMEHPSQLGIFGLGAAQVAEVEPCQEDVRTQQKSCAKYPVYCLEAGTGEYAQPPVAKIWGGSTFGHGMCLSRTYVEEPLVF